MGKIVEAILKDNIVCHLFTQPLVNDSQHGLLPKRSRLTNLLEFIEYVTAVIDQEKPVNVNIYLVLFIYFDFQKSVSCADFDKIVTLWSCH